ncbi:hypothetical protein I302_100899 [Kwoniella bestiolae CBS 10118]|uniref:F-box domain-containing protein n=1 Tax=Kwoniella bestiolae CBS 10118 TaxID=1296100 RepID=A0A1B9G6G5_9TREE|nr:hypothetical protein I302_04274 [Kwoniella bestiolae CBS 10118]OCF26588.1 hypothetical protein I302_04274 [Kwoniella bestiolae CBS 10118]
MTIDITLLPPSQILSNHSHLALLPSTLPVSSSLCSKHFKRAFVPRPPRDGSSPLSTLPTEIQLSILSHLELSDLLSVLGVSKTFCALGLSPTLHRELSLTTLPSTILHILGDHILPSVRELTLNLFPYPCGYRPYSPHFGNLLSPNTSKRIKRPHPQGRSGQNTKEESVVGGILRYVKLDQLRTLNIPFSSSYIPLEELERILESLGSECVRKLDLRGSSLSGRKWMDSIGKLGRLEELDQGFTNIHSLPSPSSCLFGQLRYLSLSSCSMLLADVLAEFIRELPTNLERLDLTRLDQLPFEALWNLRAVYENSEGRVVPTSLKEVRLVGIDHLTRRDVRGLKRFWEGQRRACFLLGRGEGDWRKGEMKTPEMGSTSRSTSFGSWSSSEEEIRTPSTSYSTSPPQSLRSSREGSGRKVSLPSRHDFLQSLSYDSDYPSGSPPSSCSYRKNRYDLTERKDGEDDDLVHINIIHSAILESEDEDGYRRFIGEVVGGTLDVGDAEGGAARGYVEID